MFGDVDVMSDENDRLPELRVNAFEHREHFVRALRIEVPCSHELIVDQQHASDPETQLGAKIDILGETFEVVGVYEPEVGARMKMPLATMQELLGASERASWILIKTAATASVDAVASRIEAKFPTSRSSH